MNDRGALGGEDAPLSPVAHIKKEVDGSGYVVSCGMEFSLAASPGSPDRQFCSSTTQLAGDGGSSQDDIKEEEGTPKRACLVCGDVASGFHYGVASCEACKAFFKRTIQGNIEYTCPAANDCEINKRRRKACQACRFQKCLRMGMLKEGVRLDRVRGGRQKYRRNAEGPYQLLPLHQLKHYPNIEENKLLETLSVNEPDLSFTTPDFSSSDPVFRTLNILSDVYDQELVKIITWAKHIPGFLDLNLNDQMRLLQSTWAEVLTLTIAFRSITLSGQLKLASDMVVDDELARDCGFIELYQQLVTVVTRIERLGITKEEYYILKALVLANSDVRIEEPQPLKALRDSILAALSSVVTALRAGSGAAHHINHLLLCLPALRQADQLHRRFWSSIHREGNVSMNKLFIEMLESYTVMDLMEFEELLLQNEEESDPGKGERKEFGKRGRKPGRKAGEKVDVRAKLERSRQSARECRARKKLRYQYLEELVADREKASLILRGELEKYRAWVTAMDEGHLPPGLNALLEEMAAVKTEEQSL